MSRKAAAKSSINISGNHIEMVQISKSDTVYAIAKNAWLTGSGDMEGGEVGYGLIEMSPAVSGNTYKVNGIVTGAYGGILTQGDDTTINVGSQGRVTGLYILPGASVGTGGIIAQGNNTDVSIAKGGSVVGAAGVTIEGDDSSLINRGEIRSTVVGVSFGKPDMSEGASNGSLTNHGVIVGMIGVLATGDTMSFANEKAGRIFGLTAGVAFQTTENSSIKNHGIIGQADLAGTSETYSLSMGEGHDRVVNDGRLYGHVMLGAGNDTIDTRGGFISGDIIGGVGDDTLITDKAKYKLTEDVFDFVSVDTVKSTVSYTLNIGVENLFLLGKKDINATGTDFDNVLKGNAGDNKLSGLGGADTFQFGTRGGTDTITDFEIGTDRIDLRSWKGIGDFDDLLDRARDRDGDVRIKVGADILIIENAEKGNLVETDFMFA